MNREQLWAPWRLAYVQANKDRPPSDDILARRRTLPPGADANCFLCRAAADDNDRENLVAFRGERTLVVLNRFPYNNGHLLVSPLAHKARLDELSDDEHIECQRLIARLIPWFEREMNAEGFNVGLNLGKVAGAGLPGHLHWHVVPRWNGDTNFMPVLAGIDVIPQSLDALWQMLEQGLKRGTAD